MTTETKTKRGEIGQRTFDAVHALVHKSGMKTTEAFKKVADETGRSVGTVQTSYYRIARQTPGSGVKTRSRKNKPHVAAPRKTRDASSSPAGELNEMARELEARAQKLREIAASITTLEIDAEKTRRITSILG